MGVGNWIPEEKCILPKMLTLIEEYLQHMAESPWTYALNSVMIDVYTLSRGLRIGTLHLGLRISWDRGVISFIS